MPKFIVKVWMQPYEYEGVEAKDSAEAEAKILRAEFPQEDEIYKIEIKQTNE